MAQRNYRQAKRNREETRKKRKLEKQQRKLTRGDEPPVVAAADASVEPKETT